MSEIPGRYESRVDEQIRTAIENGAFDDLPGKGKPLPAGRVEDENWWIRSKLRRENVSTELLLPPSLALRKEVERLPATVAALPSESDVREVVGDLNRRIAEYIRRPIGPRVPLGRVDVDAVLARWRRDRPAARPARRPAPSSPRVRPDSSLPHRPWWQRRRWWRRRAPDRSGS